MSEDIVEYFEGMPIKRTNNRVILQLSAVPYKKLLKAMNDTGLSAYKVIAYCGKPCEKCSPDITVFNRDARPVKLRRDILYSHMPENNGTNCIEKKRYKNAKSNSGSEADSQ